ncbi:MAG: DUF262 domain-containing protein [Ruminococcus sp.]
MDAQKGNIYQIFNGDKQFIIPVYQRYYSWDKEQCERLWNDIVNMQIKNKSGHFVGSIVNIAEKAMPTGVQKYMIIDGQQRMTTLTLMLIALRNYSIVHPDDISINFRRIDNVLLKNEYENGDERYKLLLTETDRNTLINLIERKPLTGVDENSRLLRNYQYFEDKINSLVLKPSEVYESIGKLQIVNITLDRAMDDPQAIFESLNSTGKELSESDLIRNHILMGLPNDEQTYIYEHYWRPMELLFEFDKQESVMDRFFRDYITMKLTKIPKVNKVYDEFKLYHNNCEFSTVEDFCKDLYTYAKYYTDIVFCKSGVSDFDVLYKDINALRMEVALPFLLKIHNDYYTETIGKADFIEIIKLCISYVFRRSICNIPTNSLNKTFATLKNEINNDDYLNSIKAFFVLRDDYKVFPSNEMFVNAFKSRDIYNMRTRNYILSHIENFDNKAPIIIENFTIEHIMPQNSKLSADWQNALGEDWQSIQKKYLHTIGNLTLTAYNLEMSDKDFEDKLEMEGGFKESALRLNTYVVKQTKWNEDTINERADILAEKALQIWEYPKLSQQELQPYIKETKAVSKYSLDSYEVNAFTKMLFDKLNHRIMNLSSNIKREFKKLYIAYKLDTNFVDVVIQKQRLRISVNMKFSEVYDPKNLCHDVTNLGRWGNGDAELFFEHLDELDDVMAIIEQSYLLQAE